MLGDSTTLLGSAVRLAPECHNYTLVLPLTPRNDMAVPSVETKQGKNYAHITWLLCTYSSISVEQ